MDIRVYERDISEVHAAHYESLLSEKERARGRSYRLLEDRISFVVRRGVLRLLLARFLQIAPEEVRIEEGIHGKPEVEGLFFNVSRSGQKILIAISRDGPLGVDIEKIQSDRWSYEMEEFLYSDKEKKRAAAMTFEERKKYLFSVWTKKEAWVKALGCGLAMTEKELSSFDTESSPHIHFVPLRTHVLYVAHIATHTPLHNMEITHELIGTATNYHHI